MTGILDVQEGDVKLFNTLEGGEITVEDGFVLMSPGLETAAYLSLFGGNKDDSTRDGDQLSWWGNIGELTENQYRSLTQHLLNSLPITSANLLIIENAVRQDLKWMLDLRIASSIEVVVIVPQRNKIDIIIDIEAQGVRSSFNFTENWEASI